MATFHWHDEMGFVQVFYREKLTQKIRKSHQQHEAQLWQHDLLTQTFVERNSIQDWKIKSHRHKFA